MFCVFSHSDGNAQSLLSGEQGIIQKTELVGKLYPNPVKQVLNIHFNNGTHHGTEILILDMIGSVVKRETLTTVSVNEDVVLELQDLENGIYFLQVQLGNAKESYRFFIRN